MDEDLWSLFIPPLGYWMRVWVPPPAGLRPHRKPQTLILSALPPIFLPAFPPCSQLYFGAHFRKESLLPPPPIESRPHAVTSGRRWDMGRPELVGLVWTGGDDGPAVMGGAGVRPVWFRMRLSTSGS